MSRRSGYQTKVKVESFKVKKLTDEGIPVKTLDLVASNNAVDIALSSVGSLDSKQKYDSILNISTTHGVEIVSKKTKEQFDYRIQEIGYCNVDKRYPEIFVFMAAKDKKDVRCYVFLCKSEALARDMCLAMAKCFQNALENWKKTKEMHESMKESCTPLQCIVKDNNIEVTKITSPKKLEENTRSREVVKRMKTTCAETDNLNNSSTASLSGCEKVSKEENELAQKMQGKWITFN